MRLRRLSRLWACAVVAAGARAASALPLSGKRAADGAAIEWIRLPAGRFDMGSDEWGYTSPVHRVDVKSFSLAKTPVTNKQYRACVAAGACTAVEACAGVAGDDLPVTCVDWDQAEAFARWVGGRLPSDAEWEYAARSAGKTSKYPWGEAHPRPRPVCENPKLRTLQGVCDMPGVWEWIADWFHNDYRGAPNDGSAWDDAGWARVMVGGASYHYENGKLISPFRALAPGVRRPDVGFRVARSADSSSAGAASAERPPEADPDAAAVESAWRRFLIGEFTSTFSFLQPKGEHSPQEIALGRRMFFDAGLSRDKTLSCSTCHVPELAWNDGAPRVRGAGLGAARRELKLNTISLLDVRFKSRFFWDGRAKNVEQAVLAAAGSPEEMNTPPDDLAVLLGGSTEYSKQFAQVYGVRPITADLAARALSAFVAGVPRAAPAPFDRFSEDREALTPLQRRGFVLFTGKAHCLRCHGGPFFSMGRRTDIGLRREAAGEQEAARKFVTPPLLNVALTAPYMHDGRFAGLADVVEFYDRGGDVGAEQALNEQDARIVPLHLTADEKRALAAFLEALGPPPPRAPAEAAPKPDAVAPKAASDSASSGSTAPTPAVAARAPFLDAASESADAPAGRDPACVKDFSIRKFLGELTSHPAEDLTGDFIYMVVRYQAAAAFHAGDMRLCDALRLRAGPADKADRLSSACREKALDMLALRALVSRSPDYPGLCVQLLAGRIPGIGPDDRAEVCSTILSHVDEPERLCSLLQDRFVYARQREGCVVEFSAFSPSVDKDYCGYNEDSDDLEACQNAVGYSRARRSGRTADCGDSEACRAMMDQGALERGFRRIRGIACLNR